MGCLFDLEENRVKREILNRKARRVLIQLPEGLRGQLFRIVEIVESTGAEALVSGDPCYGACDLPLEEAGKLNVDLIIHYGHTKLLSEVGFPIVYIPAKAKVPISNVTKKSLLLLKNYDKIGLITTAQHLHKLSEAAKILREGGKEVVVGDSNAILHPGQVLGCDYRNALAVSDSVDAFLFVGGGRFHALGAALSTRKPTYVADPFTGSVYSINEEADKVIRQRFACILEAENAETIAVIVGLKPGQFRLDLAVRVVNAFKEKGKRASLLTLRELSPEVLSQFSGVDAFVNTACPRISIDDAARFKVPVLTVSESLVVLGRLTWEEVCQRGLFLDVSWRS
ncbi:diphthamide biosynthesis enzyme Dph2 [Candidatus Bathyarchaeota archaeon]|nr:diphthamide biosynthesis enzyme Dph2 [Candidatus Bathyarchaeota archaeon]